jgi:hypothetical protein
MLKLDSSHAEFLDLPKHHKMDDHFLGEIHCDGYTLYKSYIEG